VDRSVQVVLTVEPCPGTGSAQVGAVPVADSRGESLLRRLLSAQLLSGMSGPEPAYDLTVSVLSAVGDLHGPGGEAVCGEALGIACRKLALEAGPIPLEPFVECTVTCPPDTLSLALADLKSRGARISEVQGTQAPARVRGEIALSAVLGYTTELRSLTRGLGMVQLRPVGLRPVRTAPDAAIADRDEGTI
jgi:translation elongation factor EF-G